jgi:alkyldihydroxyacetonephosphate synthase
MSERRRSFWGWGYEDRFPDAASRSELAGRIGLLLGCEPSPRDPVALDSIVLPPPRVVPRPELGGSTLAEDRIRHTHGRSFPDLVRGFSGDFSAAPDAVFYPANETEIEAAFQWARSERVTLVPFGGGTGVASGIEARVGPGKRGVATIDMSRMDRVLEVDEVSRAARMQAGATGPRIETQLASHGLTLRHYPQSFEFSTLGGWIATRAAGHFATVYTHIDDMVESVRMLTPSGVLETRRVPASGAGPDPARWVLGSEGILGIVTEAWMRVVPRPTWRASASVHFARFEDGVRAARRLSQSGLFPSNCRLLDGREAMLHGVASDGMAVLLLGFESADHPLAAWIERAIAIATGEGGTCPEGPVQRELGGRSDAVSDASTWKQAFFDAPYLQSGLVRLGIVVDTFETACTWDRFEALHASVIDAVKTTMRDACGSGIITCRFTHVYPDGPAPYYTFIAPGTPGKEIEQWGRIKRAASDALSAGGATITHHHAVGRLHRPWFDRERPPAFERALRATKEALDPDGLLNPGVLLDP